MGFRHNLSLAKFSIVLEQMLEVNFPQEYNLQENSTLSHFQLLHCQPAMIWIEINEKILHR